MPKAMKDCAHCGLCVRQCLVKGINVDSDRCISCMRCVTQRPHNVRKVNGVMVSVAFLAIKKVCFVRKECEIFILREPTIVTIKIMLL